MKVAKLVAEQSLKPYGCLSALGLSDNADNHVEFPSIPLLAARPFSAGLPQAVSLPPKSQTDLLQSMLFALQTGNLHVLTSFRFRDEVDKELHHPILSQKSHFLSR